MTMCDNVIAGHRRQLVTALLLLVIIFAQTISARAPHHRHHATKPSLDSVKGKICIGTNGRMSVPSNKEHHYRNLRDRFTNCTYVDGNLELTWLHNESWDLSFLQHIREVTGYVLISHVDVRRIVLPRLQIIRGRTLFTLNVRDEAFALMVTYCNAHSLELPALRDILSGSVGIYNNYNLCHIKTINWDEIMTGTKAEYVYVFDFTSNERECSPCDKSCEAGCWGEGPQNCQKFSKTNCSPQCYRGRCFGENPRDCCHLDCAGGCTGPHRNDCLACRNFYDDGVCTDVCPQLQRYNQATYSWEADPNGKYAYGATCVRNCPAHLLKDSGACVRSCPPKKTAVNGECVPCDGTCPKTCTSTKDVHSGNIDSFKDCTIIDGSLEILEGTFAGFQQVYTNLTFGSRYQAMHPDRLEVFSTVKEITGYINIQAYHEDFTNLSYFRNLEIIGGRQLNEFSSLYIVKTSLKSLELKSLKKINSGAVGILENKNLCYVQSINWTKIKRSPDHAHLLQNNRDAKECKAEGLICDPQCSTDGCWGAGPNQCLSCRNYQFGDKCIENCDIFSGMYKSGPKICKPCHQECASSCHGPGPDHCNKCKHARDGPYCVPQCPSAKYRSENGECVPCHPNCVDGCQGPFNTIGFQGCNSCEKAIISLDVEKPVERCLQENESCPDGYFHEWVGPQEQGPLKPLAGKKICRKCHPRCKKCTGYGFHEMFCQECTKFKRGEQCEDECPSDHFADESTQICVPCDSECRGCTGPDVSNCIKCRNLKIITDDNPLNINATLFNCTAACPPTLPNKIFPNEIEMEPYCSSEQTGSSYSSDTAEAPAILAGVLIFAVLILLVLGIIGYIYKQKVKAKKEAVKMTMVLTGCEDNEPLRPTNVKPNLAKLRIVKEAELRKGGILGFGAFGKVYKGVWVPEGEKVPVKIPVAIKVLREGSGANTSKEFMDEAYIMASVEHPNLLQLLAVCMTSEMMLITQLMPLGCLLDYVRNHKEKIGSKALLNWCTQIARGMSYLEDKRLVHRDLAARNVLVQTPNCVKITDFGLAKLLNFNEDEYKAAGGKMPIKWLALECIQHRIFTHKSDVWAFGVTIWELLTYGGRPYENISARDVPKLIENGLKLSQPPICTLDIYCIMVSCWMLDADSRPTFKQLAETFAEMARDPGRYLVIPGDKFMRLPSYSNQDERELIRNLSSAMDDPESFTEADEYLRPEIRRGITNTMASSSAISAIPSDCQSVKPCSSTSWANQRLGPESFISETSGRHPQVWNQDLLRYVQNSGIDVADLRQYCNGAILNSDGSSNKYCNDIMQQDSTSEDTYDSASKIREAQVANLRLPLPLDEDDYLMPSPQQSQNTSAYMDLIGDSQQAKSVEMLQSFPDFLPRADKGCVENPEYLLSAQDDNIPTQTLGIPTVIEEPSLAKEEATVEQSVAPASFITQRSLEEESISDHEYYNDLQRELQPLRRNETTV